MNSLINTLGKNNPAQMIQQIRNNPLGFLAGKGFNMIEKIEDVYKDHSSLEPAVLDYIDKLAHAAKCIDKLCGGEASFRVGGYTYEGGDGSYARGRMNAKRDSMGRYSRDYSRGRWDSRIEDLIKEAPDDETRQELQKIAEKMH